MNIYLFIIFYRQRACLNPHLAQPLPKKEKTGKVKKEKEDSKADEQLENRVPPPYINATSDLQEHLTKSEKKFPNLLGNAALSLPKTENQSMQPIRGPDEKRRRLPSSRSYRNLLTGGVGLNPYSSFMSSSKIRSKFSNKAKSATQSVGYRMTNMQTKTTNQLLQSMAVPNEPVPKPPRPRGRPKRLPPPPASKIKQSIQEKGIMNQVLYWNFSAVYA